MKAIVVRQPWATLIALGIKTIETRPAPPNGPMRPDGVRGLPGLAIDPGERIAIVAGAWCPVYGFQVGDYVILGGRNQPDLTYWPNYPEDPDAADLPCCPDLPSPSPLGAVVCTVTVDEALPIVANTGDNDDEMYVTVDGRNLARQQVNGDGSRLEHVRTIWMDDQLPLGDFTPGRWGWLLGNVRQTTPIPCKGKQGVFALPDDVTAALDEELAR